MTAISAATSLQDPLQSLDLLEELSIDVAHDVGPGEFHERRTVVVSAKSRRKLGKKLTIAWCTVERVFGAATGGVAVGEELDVVCCGESLAKRFAARRPEAGGWHAFGDLVVEAKRSRSGRRVARVRAYLGTVAPAAEAEKSAAEMAPKKFRAAVFAAWLERTLGRDRLETVLDVAGGRGDLAAALLRRGAARAATVVEPSTRASRASHEDGGDDDDDDDAVEDAAFRRVAHVPDLFLYPRSSAAVEAALDAASAVVALHPDEATEAAVCAAAKRGLPFAVVPCCMFTSKFPHRRQFWQFDPEGRAKGVKVQSVYLDYLRKRAEALGAACATAELALVGRNVVLYSLGAAAPRTPLWPQEALRCLAACLDVRADLCGGAVRAVCKCWLFAFNRALRDDHLGAAVDAANARGAGRGVAAARDAATRRAADDPATRAARLAAAVAGATRLGNAADLRAALGAAGGPRDVLRVAAAVHGVALGPAYLGDDARNPGRRAVLVERAGLLVTW